jgi:hypothetical protein
MMGWRYGKNNGTRVFISSVASEKVSNRSKIDSLDAENGYCKARGPRRGSSKMDFLYKIRIPFINFLREIQILYSKCAFETPRLGARAIECSFSASNESIFDRLDTFSDATDEINTLVPLFLPYLHPIIDSECWFDFFAAGLIFL